MSCDPPACIKDLRHKVDFLQKIRTEDGSGGFGKVTTTLLFSAFAKIEFTSGREILQAEKLQGREIHKVTLRYRSTLVPPGGHDLIMEYEGRQFNIRTIHDWEERKRYHILRVEEGVAQ